MLTFPNPGPRSPWRAWLRRLLMDERGQSVAGYAAVVVVFVAVLIVVLATLGDSIGQALQGLIDQLPFGG